MSKLVTHEVKVRLAAESRDKTYHFVQRHASVYLGRAVRINRHSSIYILIKQPHSDCLVPNDALIMAFCVGYSLFLASAVGQSISNVPHVPIIIFEFFE